VAVVCVVAAIVFARIPLSARGVSGYTQLWLLPDGGGVQVGVASSELETTQYRIDLLEDGQVLRSWDDVTLQPNDEWVRTVQTPPGLLEARV
jgi:hypothetical protein